MSSYLMKVCSVWAFAGTAGLATAATLTVPGDHATIADALNAANPGDVIELTSNAATYSGNLYVTKNNITIQGQAGLNPAPKIQGVSAAHPLPAQGPQKWYWQPGDPSSSNTWFDVHGAAIVNAAEGLTLRNLIIASDPLQSRAVTASVFTAGVLDFRFGSGGLVQDCILDGKGPVAAIGAERQVMTANNHVFDGVEFINGRIALEHQAGTGILEIKNSRIFADLHTLWLNGGDVSISNSTIDSRHNSTAMLGCIIGNEYGESNTTFTSCLFRKSVGNSTGNGFVELRHHDRGSASGFSDSYNTGRYSPLPVGATFVQCDFIGGAPTQFSRVVSLLNGRTSWIVKTLRFTGCNIFNINGNPLLVADFPYPGNNYYAGGTVDRFEDYNVFKQAQNMSQALGMVSGGHSITLAGDPLYADVAGANFQLASNSPAATLQNPGVPAYTGSQGVSSTSVPAVKRTVGHTGADYTSINAAIAAAGSGDLIEIIDNTAPYLEDIYLNKGNGITIQGAPSLNPRPTIQAPVTTDTVVRLASPGRNVTLRNLILDGTLLTLANSMVVDNRDAGESIIENCDIIAGPGVSYGVFSQNTRILRDCKVTCAANQPAIQQNVSGNVGLPNLHVESAGKAMVLAGGMFLISDSYVRGDGVDTINIGANTRSSYLDIRDSIVTTNASGPASTSHNLIVVGDVTTGRRTVVIDNSDLVGSLQGAGANSPTGNGIFVAGSPATTPVTFMEITDSIFFNIADHSINFNNNTTSNTIPGLVFDPTEGVENFNAFKASPQTLAAQGVTPGTNDLNLDSADLYVDAPTDFRLMASSPAATLNSTGTPAYAGSQGVNTDSSVKDWTLY